MSRPTSAASFFSSSPASSRVSSSCASGSASTSAASPKISSRRRRSSSDRRLGHRPENHVYHHRSDRRFFFFSTLAPRLAIVLMVVALGAAVSCLVTPVAASSSLSRAPSDTLSDETLRRIPAAGSDFDIHTGALLAPILVPRVPGTPGSAAVQRHFVKFFHEQLPGWQMEWHNSTAKTPATGDREVPFANLIFRRDPPWAATGNVARLTLVAHYDSLYSPKGFLGAIDSAAPCAILMHVARSIDAALTAKWAAVQAAGGPDDLLDADRGVQILLMDGEEAWVKWTATDSLYGARALAESWEATSYQAMSTFSNPLSAISLFLLLDLLGSVNPRVPSYFQTTHWAYQRMATLETRLRSLQLLESQPANNFLPESDKAANQFSRDLVEDDHVPFMKRGVDVLHITPLPFPPVWHTMADDGEHLDLPTVHDWAKIVIAFTAEWLELDGLLPPLLPQQLRKSKARAAKTEL